MRTKQSHHRTRFSHHCGLSDHVRSAITAVMLRVHLTNDPELKEITDLAVKRIDWVLRDVLPRDVTKR